MTHLTKKISSPIVSKCILLLIIVVISFNIKATFAQITPNYYVTVNPITQDSLIYTTVGRNWTLSFEAFWSYGAESGKPIENAMVTIQVNNSRNEVIDTILINTTGGLFSFNYSSSTTDVFTFTPVKLIATDGSEWNSDLLDRENGIYGLQSKSVVIWWDSFHVSLVSYDTDTFGATTVFVNVTYLLIPEEGLTLPASATYSHQTFLPKIAHNANVTINGIKSEETSIEGIFKANSSVWLPTAYIDVEVSQEGWVTTHTRFSFAHTANEPSWQYMVVFSFMLVVVLMSYFVLHSKTDNKILSSKNYPVLGGMLLAITSFISLYWGLVGWYSTTHGFDWIPLSLFGLLSFVLGIIAAFFALMKKYQSLVISAIVMPLFTNTVVILSSHDMYMLANPWLMEWTWLVLSFVSAVFICNADKEFM